MASKDTRFRKGQSGNPKGRPRGSKNFASEFISEANEQIAVNVSGRRKYMSVMRAGMKQLMAKAASGDSAAIKQVMDRYETLEARERNRAADRLEFSPHDRTVLNHLYAEFLKHGGSNA